MTVNPQFICIHREKTFSVTDSTSFRYNYTFFLLHTKGTKLQFSEKVNKDDQPSYNVGDIYTLTDDSGPTIYRLYQDSEGKWVAVIDIPSAEPGKGHLRTFTETHQHEN